MFLYAITIVVSAFLLFQVQPVIAKNHPAWFGGSAAVWTTASVLPVGAAGGLSLFARLVLLKRAPRC